MQPAKFRDVELYFADNLDPRQYKLLHPKCREVFSLCRLIGHMWGADTVITSMIRPKGTIMGESGVHATGRAIDFIFDVRAGQPQSKAMKVKEIAQRICMVVNLIYPRNDQRFTLTYHEAGRGYHFHCQIQWDKNYREYNGTVPKGHLELGEADQSDQSDQSDQVANSDQTLPGDLVEEVLESVQATGGTPLPQQIDQEPESEHQSIGAEEALEALKNLQG